MKISLRFLPAILCLFLIIAACKKSAETDAGNVTGFETEKIEGSEMLRASKSSGDVLVEQGYLLNGMKNSQWVGYDAQGNITSIQNFIAGKPDGLSIKLTNRQQIEEKAFYKMGDLHGPSATYRFGRVMEEMTYTNGKLEGTVKKYYQNGKIREEIDFKDGVQHGEYTYYSEDGTPSLKYTYENGEKVSGGIVE